jgi:hypothetical protein
MVNAMDFSNKNDSFNSKESKEKRRSEELLKGADEVTTATKAHIEETQSMTTDNNKVKALMWQLNEKPEIQNQNSILHECEDNISAGKEMFNALKGDPNAIESRIKSLDYHRKLLWEVDWLINSPYFLQLDDLNEEDLQKEYIKYFEPQTSVYYLWWVINAVLARAFDMWFFSAMNGKEWKVDEKFSKTIRITQKLVNISKKIGEEKNKK